MIDLVLQQLCQIALGLNKARCAAFVDVFNANRGRSPDSHHQVRKAETIIPKLDLIIACPGDVRIDEGSGKTSGLHSNKDHALEYADLRCRYSAAKTGRLPKTRQSFAQITYDRLGVEGQGVIYREGFLPKRCIPEL